MLYFGRAVFLRTCRFYNPNKPHNKAIYGTSATARKPRSQPYIPVPAVLLRTFSDCHKPHCKAIYNTSATAGIYRFQPYIPVPAVYLRTFSECHKPHNKAVYDTSATAGNLVCNRTFPFLPYYCVHSPIATNRIIKPSMALRQQQEYLVRNRTFPFLPYYCLHSPIATNRITKPNTAYPPTNAKTADMRNHVCRLSYQLYIQSNRIVKPNNRYTRQPASHDFPFYSAPDKVYALTAINRIAMRFIAHCHPTFRYPADSSDNSKGGI